jgi:hypothetical protein
MIHYNTSAARKHLNEIVNRVRYEKIVISLGRRGKTEVLIVPSVELDEEIPVSEMNAQSPSFDFLADEPEIYFMKDIKKRYV